ncbi:DM13 domain-containing protein [Leptolyngbya sp. FACHB-261]|uniref:DM13 domain-containing protein n=1 Tax=Leptolyngbya sp. FACHB-261 TaxID=2692806 RepID=UPI001687977E|nr:DM13 domain-containing protein [Leptolyngbya sp. FACHB-261]MBD2099493.1 DM13 domain-containing protein [Leptolyngbya sp. FACHB-261]
MKLNHLILLGVAAISTSVFSVSSYAASVQETSARVASPSALLTQSDATVAQTQTQPQTQPQTQTVALMTGTFVAGEAPTTGTARIVRQGGHRYLEVDRAFSTSNMGPDLHVLLESANRPPQSYQTQGSFVNLGKLHSSNGAQRYPIPDSVNLANFKSVVVWCRMANATFGYAPLRPASAASAQ